MKRTFLSEFYTSSKGSVLQQQEIDYLQRSITVSCKQTILQVGGLGWENKFIDGTLYKRYFVIDPGLFDVSGEVKKIRGDTWRLPIQSGSIDMVILPHSLEFEEDQHHALREIDRVLKPEGRLLVINFNPWSYLLRYKYLIYQGKNDPFMRSFIRSSKLVDWLKLLNFEVGAVTGFRITACRQRFSHYRRTPLVASYAVKAIKRRYNIIPLTPVKAYAPRFLMAGTMNTAKCNSKKQ